MIFYLGYRFFKGFIKKGSDKQEVRGEQKSKPLDLCNSDVEDAHFKDMEDREK